jgi:drug/metabolite transporter (DMT)-like permease
MLLIAATIWGMAFVAQKAGMDYVGPFTFNFSRFILAILVLIPVVWIMDRSSGKKAPEDGTYQELSAGEKKQQKKQLIKASAACGSVLFCAITFQQIGLVSTDAGKTEFITALYIVLVPVFSVALKRIPGVKCWIGVVFGTVGLYFLCITRSLSIAPGDLLILIGAGFWAAHILVIDHFLTKVVNPVRMSQYQFVVVAVMSLIGAVIFEDISISAIIDCAIPILYAGVLSGGVGYTLQILGQKHTNPTVASLILSLESVFGALFGFLVLHEQMSPREILGCVLMFVALVVSQMPNKKDK